MFIADDLGAWLVGVLADAGRKRLSTRVLGTDQDRALRSAAKEAVHLTAAQLRPDDEQQAEQLAMVINQVFTELAPTTAGADNQTMLEALQAGVASQLAVLDDVSLTGTGASSADLLGVPAGLVAQVLTGNVLRQIVARGARGGPLEPLAAQLNNDLILLRLDRVEGTVERVTQGVGRLALELRDALSQLGNAPAASTALTQLRPQSGIVAEHDRGARVGGSLPGGLARAAYVAQVSELAPVELLDRGAELADLAEFCDGEDAYGWWRGPRGAGKTALAAWFATHPPPDVRVVSFFVIQRLVGESDSNGFTDALFDQLAFLAEEPDAWSWPPEERRRLLAPLLGAVSDRLGQRGERLVLIVDGLDEDQGGRPADGPPSIASMLPVHLPAGVHVLVTSLDHFDLPEDVPSGHPLRRCLRHSLSASRHAWGGEVKARWELRRQLDSRQNREVIGLIAAAGGGELTAAELAELTALEEFAIREILANLTRRILLTWERRYTGEQAYPFRTEVLHSAARDLLGTDLARYRSRIHDWADNYRTLGWPGTTPGYLLQPYASLLAACNDLRRLSAVATDAVRHDLMLLTASSDGPALTEISNAQQQICRQPSPDLATLTLLALERYRLSERNRDLPERLPVVWARLGNMNHARELATSIPDPERRESALENISKLDRSRPSRESMKRAFHVAVSPRFGLPVTSGSSFGVPWYAIARPWKIEPAGNEHSPAADQIDEAINAARAHPQPAEALSELAESLADTDLTRAANIAEQAAQEIHDPQDQALALAHIAFTLTAADSTETVRLLSGAIDALSRNRTNQRTMSYYHRARVLAMINKAFAAIGREKTTRLADDLLHTARSDHQPSRRARMLAQIAEALAVADPDRAIRLANEAARTARSLDDQTRRAQALADVAETLAAEYPPWAARIADEADRAEPALIRARGNLDHRLTSIVPVLVAHNLWDRAERAAQAIKKPTARAYALTEIAEAISTTDAPRAARLAREAAQAAWLSYERDLVRDGVIRAGAAEGLAAAGLWDQAEAAIGAAVSADLFRSPAEAMIAKRLASARQWERAEARARAIALPAYRAHALASVAAELTQAEPERAAHLIEEAVQLARSCGLDFWIGRGLAGIAAELAAFDTQRAVALAAEAESVMTGIEDWGSTSSLIAGAYTTAGLWDQAERTGKAHLRMEGKARVLAAVVSALAGSGQWDRAERTATAITVDYFRARAFASMAARFASIDTGRSASFIDEAEQAADNLTGRFEREDALAGIADEFLANYQLALGSENEELISRLHRIIGKALIGDGWYFSLPALGRISSEAITAVCEKLQLEADAANTAT